jgi:hypothetical protein
MALAEKAYFRNPKFWNSKSEFHASGVFGHTMPSLSGLSMAEDAHTQFGRENHWARFSILEFASGGLVFVARTGSGQRVKLLIWP